MRKGIKDIKLTDEQMFEALWEMLIHFEQEHNSMNKSLRDSGDDKYCIEFRSIEVADIKNYMLQFKGIDKSFLNI